MITTGPVGENRLITEEQMDRLLKEYYKARGWDEAGNSPHMMKVLLPASNVSLKRLGPVFTPTILLAEDRGVIAYF